MAEAAAIAGLGVALVGAGMSFNSAKNQSLAMKSQADYQKSMAEVNSLFSNIQASDAIDRGDKAAAQLGRKTKSLIGTQRANLAAQGVEVDSGSALEIQQDTAALSRMDELQIRNNAWREAWGIKVEGSVASANARIATAAGQFQAQQTLLTGGIQAANQASRGVIDYAG